MEHRGAWFGGFVRLVLPLGCMGVFAASAAATQTSGGVNWLDPLQYQKPAFVAIQVPDEAATCAAGRCWYVDLSAGSGSACTSASPCAMSGLSGKAGLAGGPAYIYVRSTGGNGDWLSVGSVFGSPNSPVVVKFWAGGTINLTANNLQLDSQHDIIWDGGPTLGFKGTHNGASDTSFFVHVRGADNLTFYRTQWDGANALTAGIFDLASYSTVDGFRLINSEFYNFYNTGSQAAAIYAGPGGSSTVITHTEVRGNIFRNFACEVLEINPHGGYADALTIDGNVFHHAGMGCCSQAWACRPPITIAGMNGGETRNYSITNNLIWDTGASCIFNRSSGPGFIDNNTCYDYNNPAGSQTSPDTEGITISGTVTLRNNAIYDPGGSNPIAGTPAVSTNNLCGPGKSCGGSSQTWTAGTVLSTDSNQADFLTIGAGSPAVDSGVAVSGVTMDYSGSPRPQGAAYDIGAYEYCPSGNCGGSQPALPGPPRRFRLGP